MAGSRSPALSTEGVAYWYMRLNGFFQMRSFIVHPESRGAQRTDADLIGIRFPHRAERQYDNPDDIMEDDRQRLGEDANQLSIWIVEVKTSQPCSLNGPWTREDKKNVHRVLAAIGCFEIDEIDECAKEIYSTGFYKGTGGVRVRLVCIGRERDEELMDSYAEVRQITWDELLRFIGERLFRYRRQKAQSEQWDKEIRRLQEYVDHFAQGGHFDHDGFISAVKQKLGVKS